MYKRQGCRFKIWQPLWCHLSLIWCHLLYLIIICKMRLVSSLILSPSSSHCRHKLQPLLTYVLSLGRILERRNVPESDTSSLARRLKKILVDLNEYDHARTMARTFHLREALWVTGNGNSCFIKLVLNLSLNQPLRLTLLRCNYGTNANYSRDYDAWNLNVFDDYSCEWTDRHALLGSYERGKFLDSDFVLSLSLRRVKYG